ncbi:ABC transporter ATP-binding protein [Microbacterium thalassium]|uniref:ABC-2 type transport system ATP-binding protein n=1 Tax=Microbacterium thalassium TaxID=362649 RepID=A0A7X0FRT4_9MICO|nr:ABC transporter ATP-binding protein [Microbacterium thalassium]MBB6392528.1 ABC-2 type transport system ATP-binding protein [Microbacterium thalassium]GLK23241.1 tetronasin ABC transporter ATP-binding protein [Microbacterium thalassium]
MVADAVIDIAGLTKNFGKVRALDGFDLTLHEGEVLGFLGPNGAGKSTTIRIVLGLMRRSGGHVSLFGRDPFTHAVALHRRVAYVPGDVALWPQLTGGQCIDLLGSSGAPLDQARRADLIERFDLDPTKRIRDYSKGNRQKVALVAALAAETDLLILDEPTSGLDPLMEEVFRECVGERAADGASVLLSSHILSEVEALCESVTIIRHGKVVQSGSVAELRRLSRTTVHAVTRSRIAAPEDPAITDVHAVGSGDGTDLTFTVEPDALDRVLPPLLAVGVSTLTVRPPSLDELFLSAYEGAA